MSSVPLEVTPYFILFHENTCQVAESEWACLVCQGFQVKCCSAANAAGWLCSSDTTPFPQRAHATESTSCTQVHFAAQLFHISSGGGVKSWKKRKSVAKFTKQIFVAPSGTVLNKIGVKKLTMELSVSNLTQKWEASSSPHHSFYANVNSREGK